jgi:hypothetical protein
MQQQHYIVLVLHVLKKSKITCIVDTIELQKQKKRRGGWAENTQPSLSVSACDCHNSRKCTNDWYSLVANNTILPRAFRVGQS